MIALASQEHGLYAAARKASPGQLSRGLELVRFGRFMDWPGLEQDPKPERPRCWMELPVRRLWWDTPDEHEDDAREEVGVHKEEP